MNYSETVTVRGPAKEVDRFCREIAQAISVHDAKSSSVSSALASAVQAGIERSVTVEHPQAEQVAAALVAEARRRGLQAHTGILAQRAAAVGDPRVYQAAEEAARTIREFLAGAWNSEEGWEALAQSLEGACASATAQHYLIVGRIPGDDDDTAFLIAADSLGQAEAEFRERIYEDRSDDPEAVKLFYGDTVYITQTDSITAETVIQARPIQRDAEAGPNALSGPQP